MKNVNENIYTSVRNNGTSERVGIANHYFDRKDERYWGFTFEQFTSLLDNCITYNPSFDELPQNLSNQCLRAVRNKNEKYDKEHCFKLIPSEDLVIVMNKSEWITNRNGTYVPKPYWFNEWVVVSMWRCDNEGILYTEPQTKEYIKVGNKIYYI